MSGSHSLASRLEVTMVEAFPVAFGDDLVAMPKSA
jgi:hypothetical protein